MNDLEKKFKEAYDQNIGLIKEKLNEVDKLFIEIEKISEDAGIPFEFDNFGYNMRYIPKSLNEKFGDVSDKFIREISRVYLGDRDNYGWMDSYS